jgi:hypothetical protein
MDILEYNRLIRYYFGLFGRPNVLVLPLELLSQEPRDFVQRIMTFSGVDATSERLEALPYSKKVNASFSSVGIEL